MIIYLRGGIMKKLKNILLVIFVILLLSGCGNTRAEEISYSDLEKMLEEKQSFILEIVQDGCHNCESFSPKFEKILKQYKLTAKQINLSNISEDENTKLQNLFNVSGTPTVIFIEDGKEPSITRRIVGNRDKDFIKSKLKIAGYIK